MKRLITNALLSLLVLLGLGTSQVQAIERWKFQMSDPAATTARKLNVEYNVLSTVDSDTFLVKLFQNETEVSAQTTDDDSGVFIIDLPASGTYVFKMTALNNGDSTTKEETRTVQINNAPEPTVTTITVNQNQGGAVRPVAANQGAVNAAPDQGPAAGGNVTDQAATTQAGAAADVLGAETSKDTDAAAQSNSGTSTSRRILYGSIIALLIAAGAYYFFSVRSARDA